MTLIGTLVSDHNPEGALLCRVHVSFYIDEIVAHKGWLWFRREYFRIPYADVASVSYRAPKERMEGMLSMELRAMLEYQPCLRFSIGAREADAARAVAQYVGKRIALQ